MGVVNIHERRLPGTEAAVGALIDSLASEDDRLWPVDRWTGPRFDRPLRVGAVGGHGPIRYWVEEYQPGHWIRFRFTGPRGFEGFHEFTVHADGDHAVTLRHLIAMHVHGLTRLTWPLAIRWLHDACLEDLLDRAERQLTGSVRRPARWSPVVRGLRALTRMLGVPE
ncbi:SRPBCC family protein [Nocardia sp. CDC159]|uniref:SRPBCC family protein n=1 Tax=Nocardia pulmonis TaxID=2951408 RepID=A0A9X2EBU1_9NOCA|nr:MULTISPECIES: SRPBCC family protein [Nocardia]MCM6776580.1 SRPBCC family protein [Nocardia pulmonis]MCM6789004.1 SRPBCC family protein [Nocardia sp. CDC159]